MPSPPHPYTVLLMICGVPVAVSMTRPSVPHSYTVFPATREVERNVIPAAPAHFTRLFMMMPLVALLEIPDVPPEAPTVTSLFRTRDRMPVCAIAMAAAFVLLLATLQLMIVLSDPPSDMTAPERVPDMFNPSKTLSAPVLFSWNVDP